MRKLRWLFAVVILLLIGSLYFVRREPVDEFAALKPYIIEDHTSYWSPRRVKLLSATSSKDPPAEMRRTIKMKLSTSEAKKLLHGFLYRNGWTITKPLGAFDDLQANRGSDPYKQTFWAVGQFPWDSRYRYSLKMWNEEPKEFTCFLVKPLTPLEYWTLRLRTVGQDPFDQ